MKVHCKPSYPNCCDLSVVVLSCMERGIATSVANTLHTSKTCINGHMGEYTVHTCARLKAHALKHTSASSAPFQLFTKTLHLWVAFYFIGKVTSNTHLLPVPPFNSSPKRFIFGLPFTSSAKSPQTHTCFQCPLQLFSKTLSSLGCLLLHRQSHLKHTPASSAPFNSSPKRFIFGLPLTSSAKSPQTHTCFQCPLQLFPKAFHLWVASYFIGKVTSNTHLLPVPPSTLPQSVSSLGCLILHRQSHLKHTPASSAPFNSSPKRFIFGLPHTSSAKSPQAHTCFQCPLQLFPKAFHLWVASYFIGKVTSSTHLLPVPPSTLLQDASFLGCLLLQRQSHL